MAVRIDLNVSLDGYATTTDQTPENPFGEDWGRLVSAYTATRTFRARVLGDTTGSGTTGVDEKYAQQYFEDLGAEVMGAGMFGLHDHGDDPDWRGWGGEEAPLHVPVFVLTHTPRPSISFDNGTVFHFVDTTAEDALAQATAVANGGDVRVGGGVHTARQFLQARLVDRFHLAIAPIVLGRGESIWDGLRGLEDGYDVTSEVAESGTTHVVFTRR